MSPEQARGEPATAASDVYSAGLILQEMLTGSPPFEPGLEATELLRRAARGETRPVQGLPPDLTRFIDRLKSIEPAQRPSSVDAAEQLAWIADRPRRRRRRAIVAAVWVALLGLSVGMTVQFIQARRHAARAEHQARTAEQAVDYLAGLFQLLDPYSGGRPDISGREILDRGAERVGAEMDDQPELKATLGDTYYRLGLNEHAIPLLQQALEIAERQHGASSLEVAEASFHLAHAHHDHGELDRAEELMRRVLAIREQLYGVNHPQVAWGAGNVAEVLREQGRYGEAALMWQRALAILEHAHGAEDPTVARFLEFYSFSLNAQGRRDESEQAARRAIAIYDTAPEEYQTSLARSLIRLANVLAPRGRYEEGEELVRRALEIHERVHGPDHPRVARTLLHLQAYPALGGRPEEALELALRALAIDESYYGRDHPELGDDLVVVSNRLCDLGRFEEAEDHLRRAVDIQNKVGASGRALAEPLLELGDVHRDLGRHSEATATYVRAISAWEGWIADNPGDFRARWSLARTLIQLAKIHRHLGAEAEARRSSTRAVGLLEEVAHGSDTGAPLDLHGEALLLEALLLAGRVDEAEPLAKLVLDRGPDDLWRLENPRLFAELLALCEEQGLYVHE